MCNMPSYAFMGLGRLLLERILSVQDRDTTRMDGTGWDGKVDAHFVAVAVKPLGRVKGETPCALNDFISSVGSVNCWPK